MWSQKASGSNSWSLWQRKADGKISKVPVKSANGPFQISLGPDSAGHTVALYARCRTAATVSKPQTGCDAYRYQTSGGKEQKLSLSSSTYDEEWPVQWKDKIAFSRVALHRLGQLRACAATSRTGARSAAAARTAWTAAAAARSPGWRSRARSSRRP